MDEIISAVHVIKMYAWEKPFAKHVAHTRKLELKVLRKICNVRTIHMVSGLFTPRMALFCTMLATVWFHGPEHITAARIFVIASYFSIISILMGQRFSRGIAETTEALVALKRLQIFLELDEKELEVENHANVNDPTENGSAAVKTSNTCISMKNVTARWIQPRTKKIFQSSSNSRGRNDEDIQQTAVQTPTLDGLNIDFPKGKLTGVIGPTGSGKTSLLQTLLRELPPESGSIMINGTISYACQEPWIFAASVRQNILFGQEYDHNRYHAVVKTCALFRDFEQFEHGDLTIVGEQGLSGGQRARIKYVDIFFHYLCFNWDEDCYLFLA